MMDEQLEQQAEEQGTLDPHCASCGMPMKNPDEQGTNADGSKNEEYCCYCLVNGEKR
jgi:hypothetical protein